MLNAEWKRMLQEYRDYHDNPVCEATHLVGIPIILASLPALLFSWKTAALLFAGGWALQFIGHKFQGNPPKFFGDWRNLIVGAIWWFDTALRSLGLNKRVFGT